MKMTYSRDRTLIKYKCECCGREEVLTPKAAYLAGWDYPPYTSGWGMLGPRLCPNCPIDKSLWWRWQYEYKTEDDLTEDDLAILKRIEKELE